MTTLTTQPSITDHSLSNQTFNQADISSVQLAEDGNTLLVTLKSGEVVTIGDAAQLASNNISLTLNDGSTIPVKELVESMALANTIINIDKPVAGEIVTYNLKDSQKFHLNFDPVKLKAAIDEENGVVTIAFKDKSKIILLNYAEVANFSDSLEFSYDTAVDCQITSLKNLIKTFEQTEVTQKSITNDNYTTQIAKGKDTDLSAAERLAAIEPAAGDAASAQGNAQGNIRGYGFNSRLDGATNPFGNLQQSELIGNTTLGTTTIQVNQLNSLQSTQTTTTTSSAAVVTPPATIPPSITLPPVAPAITSIVNGVNGGSSVVQVLEDNTVFVPVTATISGNGTQTTTFTLNGVAPGWTVNGAGWTPTGVPGQYTLTLPAGTTTYNGGISLTPPTNSDVDLTGLSITSAVTQAGQPAVTSTSNFSVAVDAVADAPTITASNVAGNSNTAIALNIAGALTDTDGSEVITGYHVTGVPAGYTLSAGTNLGGGIWSLTPAQIAGLTIQAPANTVTTLNLGVTVFNSEANFNGAETNLTNNTNQASTNFNVQWNSVAPIIVTPPAITSIVNGVNGGSSVVQVLEDNTVFVPVTATISGNGTQTTTFTLNGVAPGWTVNGAGWTPTGVPGQYTLTLPAGTTTYNGGISLTPPTNSDVDLTGLSITSAVTQAGQPAVTSTSNFSVAVDAVADAPTITASNVAGNSNTAIALNIAGALTDTDGSEVITGYHVTGVPAGYTLSAGTNLGGGIWSLTPAQIAGLTIQAPANTVTTLNLGVTVFNSEANFNGAETNLTNNTNQASTNFNVQWNSVAPIIVTPPAITSIVNGVNGGSSVVQVLEDNTVFVPVTATISGNGTQTTTFTLNGVAPGWTVNGAGWTPTGVPGQYTLTLPAGTTTYNGGISLTPPTNSDVDLTGLSITSAVTQAGQPAVTSTSNFSVAVDAVADAPTITASNVAGNSNTAIALNIAGALTDTDGSEVITGYHVTGVPAGYTLSAGTNLGGGIWSLTPAQIAGLTIQAPANTVTTLNLGVTVFNSEANFNGAETNLTNNTNQASTNFNVQWNSVAPIIVTPPAITSIVNGVNGGSSVVQVLEDNTVFVPVTATISGNGTQTTTFTLNGVAPGWTVNGAGWTPTGVPGQYTLTLPAGTTTYNGGISLTPPTNSDVDLTGLSITSAVTQAGQPAVTSTSNFSVAVDAVADAPILNTTNTSGQAGQAIGLNIATALVDTDGSEIIDYLRISGLPTGATLSAGTQISPGVWQLSQGQLAGLSLITTAGTTAGSYNLVVQSFTRETNLSGSEFILSNNTASATNNLQVTLTAPPNNNSIPIVTSLPISVDETNLNTSASASGQLNINYGNDSAGSIIANGQTSSSTGLTSHGQAVNVTAVGNTYFGTVGNQTIFTMTINANGQYTFNLTGPLDHPNSNDPNDSISLGFGVTVSDSNGDTRLHTINVAVFDDAPLAANDSATFSSVIGTSGNVIANDYLSQDGNNHITAISFNGTTLNVPISGTTTIIGQYGTLAISADGSYSYTAANPSVGNTTDVFTYTLSDGDGDPSQATLSLTTLPFSGGGGTGGGGGGGGGGGWVIIITPGGGGDDDDGGDSLYTDTISQSNYSYDNNVNEIISGLIDNAVNSNGSDQQSNIIDNNHASLLIVNHSDLQASIDNFVYQGNVTTDMIAANTNVQSPSLSSAFQAGGIEDLYEKNGLTLQVASNI